MRNYPNDLINGLEVPPTIINEDRIITGVFTGTIYVEAGKLIIAGKQQGTLSIHRGAVVEVIGEQNGSVHLNPGSKLIITGKVSGSTKVDYDSLLVIERGGVLAGSLSNNGKVVLRGTFGGARRENGEFVIEGGTIKQPTIKNGISYYEWYK